MFGLVKIGQAKKTSEEDFFSLTTNYLMSKDAKQYTDELNVFFNPMKADVTK